MKKLFTLLVLMTCFLGTNAKEIEDYAVDFTQKGTSTIGWKDGAIQDEWITADADGVHFYNPEAMANWYTYQLWLVGGNIPTEVDVDYTVTFVAKVSTGTATVRCKIGDWNGGFSANVDVSSTEYQEYTFTGKAATTGAGFFIQFGDYVGTLSFKSFKVTHEGKEEKPVEWIPVEGMVNGDAESAWPAWALETTGGINANWRGERTAEICAWGLTMGRNYDDQCPADINSDSYRARPFPADIEVDPKDPNNHVFAVHVTQIADIEGGGDGSVAWSNQFWIQSPKTFKAGTQVKVSFRYRADNAASVPTQMHKIYPSNYLNSNGVGDVDFTSDWKTFEKEITWAEDGWSIAFNLTNSNRDPNVYYFDDLKFELMKLDEGFFAAAANTTTGIEYDFDTATEFEVDPNEPDVVYATVGTVGNQDSWVNEVMISTVRGNDKAFKGATIKPSGTITGTDDNWLDFVAGSNYKIKLPAAGVWQIFIAPEDAQILFMQLEGDALAEPVAIVTNEEEIVINAVEREPTSQEQPADEEAGIPAGTGATWDNQFFIFANRKLNPDEVTVLEFDYSATKEARSTSAWQNENGYVTGAFNLEGDNIFNTEVKHFKQTLTVPAKTWQGNEIDGITFISFDLACIKDANDYTFTNIKWYLADEELNANNQTMENLISATGTSNFKKKIGAGTEIIPLGIENVINTTTTGSDVIYNLSGQRVSKDYKGIVIKNGKKVIQK